MADDIQKVWLSLREIAKIEQGANRFSASEILVYFNKKRKAKRYEAKGGVNFDITESGIHYRGRAERIVYSPNSSKYLFYGAVVLEDLTNQRKIEAETLSFRFKDRFCRY